MEEKREIRVVSPIRDDLESFLIPNKSPQLCLSQGPRSPQDAPTHSPFVHTRPGLVSTIHCLTSNLPHSWGWIQSHNFSAEGSKGGRGVILYTPVVSCFSEYRLS